MPLPLAPLLPLALRIGAVATAGIALGRYVRARTHTGRTDMRAEDALDDLGEGVSVNRADVLGDGGAAAVQRNATARVKRRLRFRGKTYELDAGLLARLRIREVAE